MTTYQQLRNPNFNIPVVPGECLVYVREVFNVPAKYGTAAAEWAENTTKHAGVAAPLGVSVPVHFTVATNPLGHVAVQAPDGSVWSDSVPSGSVALHESIAALEKYYGNEGLRYIGWTETVNDVRVVNPVVVTTPPPVPSGGLTPAKGTFKVTVTELNVRTAPTTTATIVAQYKDGQTFTYDSYIVINGFVWLSYLTSTGTRHYVAEGPADGNSNDVYGTGGVR